VTLAHLHRDPWSEPLRRDIVPSILVTDPDPQVAVQVRNHLAGYEVLQVEERTDLGKQVRLYHPAAVVLNTPPGRAQSQGVGLCAAVPIVECSLPSESWLADDLKVAACLTKPIDAEQLLGVIERMGGVQSVMIVDDDRGFRQLVEQMLDASGQCFEIRHASDGAECLQAMRERVPGVLLLDLVMPEVDGFDVMAEMRKDPGLASVPVVLLTATTFAESVLRQRDSCITIRRPGGLSPAEVLRCLQAVIAVLEPRYDERSEPDTALLSG
jgi:CheY-like chemotaxis protein